MKRILPVILSAILAGCAGSPVSRQKPVYDPVSFTGDYTYIVNADVPPRAVFQARPTYPTELRANLVSGHSMIGFIVETDGSTSQVQIVNATEAAFGDSARECVTKWRFQPGLKGGRPVRVAMEVPIAFTVNAN